MKKILLYLCIISLLFGLSACGKNVPKPQSVTQPSGSTATRPIGSESTTTVPTTSSVSTTMHTHKYTASVTKKAGCTTDGVRTFKCSCGDSYTEKIEKKGHSWGKWLAVIANNPFEPGGKYRICTVCSTKETEKDVSSLLRNYVTLVGWLDRSYDSTNELTSSQVATSVTLMMSVDPVVNWETGVGTRTYPIADINAHTKKCFGRTFDFTGIQNVPMSIAGSISYVASENALVWTFPYGGGDARDRTVFDKYLQNADKTEFKVIYHWEYTDGSTSEECSFLVSLKNGNYVITSIDQTKK